MALEIGRNGIVRRDKDGAVTILRPGANGGAPTEIEVPPDLADEFQLATGDIVAGDTEALVEQSFEVFARPECNSPLDWDSQPDWEAQVDAPNARYPKRVVKTSNWPRRPMERLTRIASVNGLDPDEAKERPFPRTKRSQSERTPPDRALLVADGPEDATGRMLDFACPLGAGIFGVVYGPHGGGLTWTLQSALHGIRKNAPDCILLVLLLRPRAEEATEWRRKVPEADVLVGLPTFTETPPEQTLELCALVLEAAQRQTELGRDVVLAIDSLTALWGTMLEGEQADAQLEADISAARNRIREWTQRAGSFHGEAPLGGGLGGSLTILGSVWCQEIDIEAEEERDTHPHLRLLEHLLPEASWLTALSEPLKRRRLFPAIDIKQCRSQYEERLLPAELVEALLTGRGSLPRKDPLNCYRRLMEAIEASKDLKGLIEALPKTENYIDEKRSSPAAESPNPAGSRDTRIAAQARAFFIGGGGNDHQ